MKGLTIHQPWASLIVGAPPSYDDQPTDPQKPVENRGWRPPQSLIGQRLAIHAGKAMTGDVLHTFKRVFIDRAFGSVRTPYKTPGDFPRGAVVGVATLDRVITTTRGGRIIDAFTLASAAIDEATRRFYTGTGPGDYGWIFRGRRALATPVPCNGAQGPWTLPEDIERAVSAQIEAP